MAISSRLESASTYLIPAFDELLRQPVVPSGTVDLALLRNPLRFQHYQLDQPKRVVDVVDGTYKDTLSQLHRETACLYHKILEN